jgi:choline/ethanolamine kinase
MQIARKLREFHNAQIDIDRKPRIFKNIRKLLAEARSKTYTSDRVIDFEAFARDVDDLEAFLGTVESPIVFCHNDLQYGNIMKTNEGVIFIDFEYSHYNPRGFDLGNHFSEWCYNYHGNAPHVGDFTKYPTVDEQRRFCQAYLDCESDDSRIESLREEANAYALATHLFWSLWGFIQSTQSTIDYDFFGYAICRWGAYKSHVSRSKLGRT